MTHGIVETVARRANSEILIAKNSAADERRGMLHNADRRVEWIAVDRLTPCKANARIHSRKQIRQIADRSIALDFATQS
jgi:hypothetical protein